ncbi:hypothetical protein WDU94_010251 [Cyamophila willieti]
MEVDIPYESRLGGGDLSSFSKGDHSYLDMDEGDGDGEGGLVIVTNGSGGGGGGGGESTLYSSSSSLSSTMSPLHNPPSHHLSLPLPLPLPSTHIQVISSTNTLTSTSSSSPSSLPIHILPGRTPPTLEPMTLTMHPHTPPSNGSVKHSPPSPTVIVTDATGSPAHQASTVSPNSRASLSPPGGVIQSGGVISLSNGYSSPPSRVSTLAVAPLGRKSSSPPNPSSVSTASVATIIKSGETVFTPKLIALPHSSSPQVLFTSTHPKMLPSTASTMLPLPSLQPISTHPHPHPIILKSVPQPPHHSIVNGARLVMPHKTTVTSSAGARILHK